MPYPQTHPGPLSVPSRHRAHKQSWYQAWVLASASTAGPASPWPPHSLCFPPVGFPALPTGLLSLSPHRSPSSCASARGCFVRNSPLLCLLCRPAHRGQGCRVTLHPRSPLHGMFNTSLLRVDGKQVEEEGARLPEEQRHQCRAPWAGSGVRTAAPVLMCPVVRSGQPGARVCRRPGRVGRAGRGCHSTGLLSGVAR